MEPQAVENSIFTFFDRYPLHEEVYEQPNILVGRGYVEVEDGECLSRLQKFYDETYQYDLTRSSTFLRGFALTLNPNRIDLNLPESRVLKKGDKRYIAMKLDPRITAIVQDGVVDIKEGGYPHKGLVLENLFITGNDGKVLDAMSLRAGVPARNIVSFEGGPSFFLRPSEDREGGISYLPQVSLRLPTSEIEGKATGWNAENLIYTFLHENSHAALNAIDEVEDYTLAQRERNANAVALQATRILDRRVPKDAFIDPNRLQSWYENQLLTGYDVGLEPEPWRERKTVASNQMRKIVRRRQTGAIDE